MDYREGCKRMLDRIANEKLLRKLYQLIAIYYARC